MSSPLLDHGHRPTQLGRADSSATGSSAYTQTTRSSSAATNYVLHSPSTTAESSVQSPKASHLPPAAQSAFKQQTHSTALSSPAEMQQQPSLLPSSSHPNNKPPLDVAAEDAQGAHTPWKLEFRGVVRFARWVSAKGNTNASASSTSSGTRKQQQQQRSRPLRPKKPLTPIQPPSLPAADSSHPSSPPLASPVNHRRTTFDIVSPLVAVPSEMGTIANPTSGSTNNNNNVTAQPVTLPPFKFTRGLSLIEALDVPPSSSSSASLAPPGPIPPSISAPPSTLTGAGKPHNQNGKSRPSTSPGTLHNNVNNAQSRQPARASTPGRDPIAAEEVPPGAPHMSKVIRLDERTTTVFAGGVVVLNSDVSRSGSPSPDSPPARPVRARKQQRAPRPNLPKPSPTQVDDEDDVFFTGSGSSRQPPLPSPQHCHQHRFPDGSSNNIAYVDEDEDDDDDDDEYEYDSPKAWRRMSGVDRVHARRERRRKGVSGFRNSMQLDGAADDEEVDDYLRGPHNEGGNHPTEGDEKVPRTGSFPVMMGAASAAPSRAEEGASSGERVVAQSQQEAPPLKQKNSDGQVFLVPSPTTTTTPTIRPRPPRPLPPIPIIGLNNHHIRLSTEGAGEDEEENEKKRRGLTPTLNSAAATVSLASPSSSTVFSHSQGTLLLPNGSGLGATGVVGSRKNRNLLSAPPPPSDARFSVVSAEWVKVDAEDMDANEFGMTSSNGNGNGGSRRFGSFGRKSYSEAGHHGGSSPPPVTSSNRFLFPFFSSSPASEEEDRSSSLHSTVVDHRFFPFQTAVSDVGHGAGSSGPSSPRRSGDAAEVLASGGAGKRDSLLLRSKSARLPQRVSMIEDTGSDNGHGAMRRVSKKAIIVGEREPVVKRKQSAGNVLKDRLRSSFGLKKVLGGDGETTGGGGGFFGSGKGKEKEKQQQQQPPRSSTPRPQTPVREIRLDDNLAEEVTPSSKATRRKSVLVKKRPSTAISEGLEKGNPKSRSTTSLGLGLGLGKERKSTSTPRPSMTSEGKPENIPLPSSPGSGSTVDGSPVRRASTTTPLSRRFTGKFGSQKKRNRGGSLSSSVELGIVGSVSDAGHSQGHSRVASEAVATGRRRGSTSGGSGFMGFFSGLSMTSITSSSNVNRIPASPASTPKSGKLTKPNPLAANLPTTWSPSYGLGRGHSTSSSTFFGGSAATPASILNVTAPGTPESPYVGLSESPVMSTIPLRSTSPSPLATTTPRRSSTSLLFSTPKALHRISEGSRFETSPMSISSVVETAENAGSEEGPDAGTPKGWVKVKPRKSVSSFLPAEDDIPPVPPIPAALASQVLIPAPPLLIPGRRPLPPPPVVVNPDTVHKKAPLVSLAYTGKQGYYAHEEARLQLQREIADEDPETPPSTTAHGDLAEPNPDMSVEYPLTPRLKENILRAHLYTSPSSPTAKLSTARMGSMYAFPRTESTLDDDLVMFKPNRPHLPHRQSSASAKRWTLAVNQIPDDSEFLKEIDDLRKSRQEIATASRRASFRKTVEGSIEDEPCSDGELDEGSDEEGVWMKARRAMLTVREMMRTETSYRNHLIRLWEADSANPTPLTPPTFLTHLPSLISASTLLSSRLEEDPSAWGVSAAFLGAEDALEKAFSAWCGVVGQVMLELAGNTPPISTSASRTSLYNRKSSTGPRDVLDKEKPAPKRADTVASSISGGSASASGKLGKKPKSRPGSTFGIGSAPYSTGSKPLSVQDIAIMPSQRVPRYVLLFKDLLEQTPVTSPSRALVERALQGAMRIAKNCDDAQQNSALVIPSP
ncbi:hypothetical protein FRC04_002046 [Tulasnella sp. 424]|nr:hypothetical protein FRC04_002046 [Tulasnella sp. 424]KAG8968252.1 hypothetical protein FRC05_001633 [Tulasnella sp. 425]